MNTRILFTTALLLPVCLLAWRLFNDQLGAQPAEKMNHELGELGLKLLLANLYWGALLALGWWPKFLRKYTYLRRHLGVVTFLYLLMHITFYVLKEGDVGVAVSQVFEKTYLIFGILAFLIVTALTITSNNYSVRKLGRNWKKLHKLVYVALGLVIVHFVLIEKDDWMEILPLVVPLSLLYAVRILNRFKRRPPGA